MARSGMVLLFVVVLLTLLAVMGGAYLISSRIDNSQVSPTDRGGEANPMGLDAADRIDQIMLKAQDATQRKLLLDAFAYTASLPPKPAYIVNAGADWYPNAQRQTSALVWRATPASSDALMPVRPPDGTPLDPDELGVFIPMGPFGGFDPTRLRGFLLGAIPPANPGDPNFAVKFPYYHVDGLGGTDPHLASRLPFNLSGDFYWQWVSAPLVGVPDFPVDNIFVNPLADPALNAWISFDPRPTMVSGFDPSLQRALLAPGTFGPIAYPTPPEVASLSGANHPEFYNDRLRTWPAFIGDFDFAQDGPTPGVDSTVFPAADADGDGVADAGLVPIVSNEAFPVGNIDRYRDSQTGYVYLVGIRIVDNNDAINVNTALARSADVRLPPDTAGIDLAIADYETLLTTDLLTAPNRGIYLSNIGLFELFFPGVDGDSNGYDDTGGGLTRNAQFRTLLPTLLGDSTSMLVGNTAAVDDTNPGPPRPVDIQHATLGELLAMNRDRLLDFAGTTPDPNTANGTADIRPFRTFDEDGALAYQGGGLLMQEVAPTRLENTALDALRTSAGNFVPNPKMMFEIFPLGPDMGVAGEGQATMRALWAAHFKHADPDMTDFGSLQTVYGGPLPGRFGAGAWPLSPRAALVAHNGTGQAFRPHTLLPTTDLSQPDLVVQWQSGGVNVGMPPYLDDGSGITPRPPVRASANTAGFAELWRAFWNVMLEPDFSAAVAPYTGPVPSFVPGQRLPAGDSANTTERMFRNDFFTTRWGSNPVPPAQPPDHYQMLTLRAALAAINSLDIRDVEDRGHSSPGADAIWGTPDDVNPVVTAADIVLEPAPGSATGEPYLVRVAGSEAQPFITEVFVVFDAGNIVQYVGLELHNPYPFELRLENWYLIGLFGTHRTERWTATGSLDPISVISLTGADFSTPINVTIPANSYVVLQNDAPPATITLDAQAQAEMRVYTGPAAAPGSPSGLFVPSGSGRIQDGTQIVREFLLMRPLDPTGPVATDAAEIFNRYVPVDFFDPSGADATAVVVPPGTDPSIWRYVRPNDERSWKFVSHGAARLPVAGEAGSAGFVPVAPPAVPSLGARDLELAGEVPSPAYGPVRSIPWGPVLSGPVTVDDDNGVQRPIYPYGGFARDGDALGIPFFGAFKLYRDAITVDSDADGIPDQGDGVFDPATDQLHELIAPTLDAFFVESENALIAPATTHIARFIPQGTGFVPASATPDEGYNWAGDFFEYITTLHAPGKDYLPHADTRYADDTTANPDNVLLVDAQADPQRMTLPPATQPVFAAPPDLTDNDGDGYANGYRFDTATGTWVLPANLAEALVAYREAFLPVEGQLNLNTASFGLLKTLPLAVGVSGQVDVPAALRISGATPGDPSTGLAGTIFMGRDPVLTGGSGMTYDSLFRLNALPEDFGGTGEFRDFGAATGVTRRFAGDITGMKHQEPLGTGPTFADVAGGTGDAWYHDNAATPVVGAESYEDHTIQLTRISNLSTLRSDSYTVYIVVQAWENFGQPPGSTSPAPARMIRQERSAFIVDRSGILPFNPLTNAPWTPDDVNGDAWRDALKITPVPTR